MTCAETHNTGAKKEPVARLPRSVNSKTMTPPKGGKGRTPDWRDEWLSTLNKHFIKYLLIKREAMTKTNTDRYLLVL